VAFLEKLMQKVAKQGSKVVVGNKGYARFLKVAKGSVSIDEASRQSGHPTGRQVCPDHQHQSVSGGI